MPRLRSSLPNAIGQGVLVQKKPAPWTFVILRPILHAMNWRDGTLWLEMQPFVISHAFVGQVIQRRLKAGRHGTASFEGKFQAVQPERKLHSIRFVRHPKPGHRVIKRSAIRANNSPDKKIQPTIRLARNLRPITALTAFKPIRSAHG
jgi:hypothetical protein